jgi:MocE subfamily Rieske [2Fe-2S] domain protein
MPWIPVCRADKLKVGESVAYEADGRTVAVFNVEGEYFATDDRCTHEETSLADGFLEDHLIECPLHGSQFDLRTGEPLSLPAVIAIRTYPTKIEEGEVFVQV